jgi:hypothetical protein
MVRRRTRAVSNHGVPGASFEMRVKNALLRMRAKFPGACQAGLHFSKRV